MKTREVLVPPAVAGESGRVHILSVVGIAAVLRLTIVWLVATRFPHDWLFKRGIELGLVADSLQGGRGFSSPYGGSTGPTALLAPGYPAIIAVIFHWFGSFTLGSAIAVMTLQVVFALLTVLVMMRLAHRMFGAGTANIAGIVWAVSIPLLWMPTIFWESCLSTLVLILFVALTLRCATNPSLKLWLTLGAMCGIGALINPALLMVFFALIGWAAYQARSAVRLRYAPLGCVLLAVVVLAPWLIRNENKLHAFIPVRSCFGFELWNGNQPQGGGLLQEGLHPSYNRGELELYSSIGEVSYMRQKQTVAVSYIRSHPAEFVRLTLRRVFLFWTGMGQRAGGDISWIIVFHAMFTTVFGLAGLVLLLRRQKALALMYTLPLLIFPLPYYITHADFRYRLVLDPLLTILAAYSITRAYAAMTEKPIANASEQEHFARTADKY